MKILHTSDWHLGRTLHGADLHDEQAAFQDWLVDLVQERGVDVVVIPGDVYDRAIPPIASVRQLSSTLARLADTATVVLTPGNHDSADRLGFGAQLMRDRSGVHILTDLSALDHPVVVPDDHGDVLFFGLPYLEPDLYRSILATDPEQPLARSHEAVTRAALDRVRARIAGHAGQTEGDSAPEGTRSVVLAHTFVSGGEGSHSERDLSVGGVDSVPGDVFTGIDYLALGHLHGCQDMSRLVGSPARYSGSPLAFSFSEKNHHKSVLLVELGAPGEVEVERIATPVPRSLTELRGPLEAVLQQAQTHRENWIKAIITDTARPPHLMETLRNAFPHLLETLYEPEGREQDSSAPVVSAVADPVDVMADFLAYVTGAGPTGPERQVLEDAARAVRTAQQEAS